MLQFGKKLQIPQSTQREKGSFLLKSYHRRVAWSFDERSLELEQQGGRCHWPWPLGWHWATINGIKLVSLYHRVLISNFWTHIKRFHSKTASLISYECDQKTFRRSYMQECFCCSDHQQPLCQVPTTANVTQTDILYKLSLRHIYHFYNTIRWIFKYSVTNIVILFHGILNVCSNSLTSLSRHFQ